jgi:tellurite resistance-related uncharacterized protein
VEVSTYNVRDYQNIWTIRGASSVDNEMGHLVIRNEAGRTLAVFAPGCWDSVQLVADDVDWQLERDIAAGRASEPV